MSAAPGRLDQTMPPAPQEPSVQVTASPVEQPALIAQVERLHAIVALVASVVAFALTSRPIWSAVVAGTLVGAANFHMLALLTTRLVSGSNTSRQVAIGVLLLKFTVLAGVLGAVVQWLKPDGVTFVAALTLAPVCLVTVVLRGRKEAIAPTDSPLEVR
jgi:hypothetical protein